MDSFSYEAQMHGFSPGRVACAGASAVAPRIARLLRFRLRRESGRMGYGYDAGASSWRCGDRGPPIEPDFDTAWMHGREFPRHNKEHTAEAGTGRVSRDSGELKDRRGLWNL